MVRRNPALSSDVISNVSSFTSFSNSDASSLLVQSTAAAGPAAPALPSSSGARSAKGSAISNAVKSELHSRLAKIEAEIHVEHLEHARTQEVLKRTAREVEILREVLEKRYVSAPKGDAEKQRSEAPLAEISCTPLRPRPDSTASSTTILTTSSLFPS